MADQFAELENRKRAGIPPSRVGARSALVSVPAESPQEQPAGQAAASAAPSRPKPEAASSGTLAPSTISLDRRTEELLEAVRTAGRFARPRVDANRSATIRLAMAVLGEKMTPEEIVTELARRAPRIQTMGRKAL